MTGYRKSISKGSGGGGGEGTLPDPVTYPFTEYSYNHSSWPYEESTTKTEVTFIQSWKSFYIEPWPTLLPIDYPTVEIVFDTLPDVTDYINTEFPITYESSLTDGYTMDIHIIPVDYVEESEGQETLFQKAYSGDIGFSEFELYDYPATTGGNGEGGGEGESKTSIQLRRPKSYVKLNFVSNISKVAADPNPGFTVGGNYPGMLGDTAFDQSSLFPDLCVYPETLLANRRLYLGNILNRRDVNYWRYIKFVAGKHLCNHPHGLFVDLAGVGDSICYVLFKFFITLKVGD